MNKLLVRAKLAGKVLRFVPFVRMAALNGSIVRGEENSKSDIDILIIARAGRLYTTRFLATFLIALTGYRRHGNQVAGRICLNCYLNDKNPDITPEDTRNMAKVAKAYKYMIPLVDDGISRKFFKINKWFEEYEVSGETHSQLLKSHCFRKFPLQGFNPRNHSSLQGLNPCKTSSCHPDATPLCHPDRVLGPVVSLLNPWRDLWRTPVALFEILLSGKFGDYLEQKLMSYQIKRILKNKQTGDQIYVSESAIKLHPKKR